MINPLKVKDLYESRRKDSNGVKRFVVEMRNMMGLCDKDGNDYRDANGNRIIKDKQLDASQFSLKALAEGIFGESFYRTFDVHGQGASQFATQFGSDNESRIQALSEGVGAPLDPSAFVNINAYSILTGGLIEVRILESFQNPSFIGDKLAKTVPTRLNGQKIIQIAPIGDRSAKRAPGEQFPRAQMGGRWVQTPETRELALAIDVSKEAVFFDLTQDLLEQASSVGTEVAYRKELDIIDTVIGAASGSPFNWNGNNYAVYANLLSSLGYNSLLTSNGLVDWTSLNSAMAQLQRNVDPDTKKRILINPNAILLTQSQVATANLILQASMSERRTGAGSPPQTGSNPLNVSFTNSSPYQNAFEVLTSPLLEQELVNTGVAADLAAANNLWFLMDTSKAFYYMQNQPMTIQQATGSTYSQLNQGIVASYFASERGIPAVISPWHLLKCTG